MYFSEHNEDVVYENHDSGLLEVEGEGPLCKEDTEVWPDEKNWGGEYDTLSVKEGITALKEGFLEAFPNLECLILSRTVTAVETTPALDKAFRKRKLLVRGEYDSYAETFAKEKKLDFLHCDIPLACDKDEVHYEVDWITLRFHENGAPDIHYNCFTPGSSAGSYGGGEIVKEIPRDFYEGCTPEAFADTFPERIRDQLLENGMLVRFLEAANRRLEEKRAKKEKETE